MGRYTHFASHHHPQVKSGTLQCLTERARRICEDDNRKEELKHIRDTFLKNGYLKHVISQNLKKKPRQQPLTLALVPWLSSHFCHCFLYNLLLRSALVVSIFRKWLQDLVWFGNPWIYRSVPGKRPWALNHKPSIFAGRLQNWNRRGWFLWAWRLLGTRTCAHARSI